MRLDSGLLVVSYAPRPLPFTGPDLLALLPRPFGRDSLPDF